jgi:hypothetical protein
MDLRYLPKPIIWSKGGIPADRGGCALAWLSGLWIVPAGGSIAVMSGGPVGDAVAGGTVSTISG